MDWRPIESAPKDGRWVLLEGEFDGGDTSSARVGRYSPVVVETGTYEWHCLDTSVLRGVDDGTVERQELDTWYPAGRVAGWMPLPPPPTNP